jgi:hypothetical protein
MEVQKTRPIIVDNDYDFFYNWLSLVNFSFKLTESEMKFLAALLTERNSLSKVILDQNIIDQVLFSKETKDKIVDRLKLKNNQEFENRAYNLRKKSIITENNNINKFYIPKVDKDLRIYSMMFTILKKDGQG